VPLDFETNHAPFYRFFLAPDPRPHGYVHPHTVEHLPWPPSFAVDHAARSVTLLGPSGPAASDSAPAHVNAALQEAADAAIAASSALFPTIAGRHSEPFQVVGARVTPSVPVVHVERFVAPLFGIAMRGAHLTAFVRPSASSQQGGGKDKDELLIWVARRSRHLFSYPGALDSTVAGGVKATDSPWDCILAESVEEASLPLDLVRGRTRAAGVLTLATRGRRTDLFHAEMLYVYDLELPADIVPRPGDDEVEAFELMPASEVRRRLEARQFKPNVGAVLVDFFVRHGLVTAESEGQGIYADICSRLHRRLPMPVAPDQ
jgi:8-oxo-dGTP pyrophosphatase MutT (NUDIX family)